MPANHLPIIQDRIGHILGIPKYSLYLLSVKRGCIEMKLLAPAWLSLSLKNSQLDELKAVKVLWMECGSETLKIMDQVPKVSLYGSADDMDSDSSANGIARIQKMRMSSDQSDSEREQTDSECSHSGGGSTCTSCSGSEGDDHESDNFKIQDARMHLPPYSKLGVRENYYVRSTPTGQPTYLSQQTLKELVHELTDKKVLHRDWRGLADVIGLYAQYVCLIEQHKQSGKAWVLLEVETTTKQSTVRKLVIALTATALQYQICLDILRKVVDITSDSLETERLVEDGGLDTVKAVYFPQFKETGIVLCPEVQSRNVPWPEGESPACREMALIGMPITYLPQQTLQELVHELTDENTLQRDWRGLADVIGFTAQHIRQIEQHRQSAKAWVLFDVWAATQRSTVRKMVIALTALQQQYCLDILRKVVDITSVSLETERLLEEGGLDTVKTVYFPRFGETDIFVFPEVQSRNHMPEAWPEGGSHALLQEQDTGSLVVSAEPLPSDVQFRSQPTRACEKHLMRSTTSRQLTTSESTTQSLQHSLENDNKSLEPTTSQSMMISRTQSLQHSMEKLDMSTHTPNSVFISYYPESRKHNSKVASLAKQLQVKGHTVYFDDFGKKDIKRCRGINQWKEWAIQRSETIVVVCSPKYREEDYLLMDPDRQRRPKKPQIEVDCSLLRTIHYNPQCESRLIPVILDRHNHVANQCLPVWLQGFTLHRWPTGAHDLVYSIAGKPRYKLPPVTDRIDIKPIVIHFPKAYQWNPYDL